MFGFEHCRVIKPSHVAMATGVAAVAAAYLFYRFDLNQDESNPNPNAEEPVEETFLDEFDVESSLIARSFETYLKSNPKLTSTLAESSEKETVKDDQAIAGPSNGEFIKIEVQENCTDNSAVAKEVDAALSINESDEKDDNVLLVVSKIEPLELETFEDLVACSHIPHNAYSANSEYESDYPKLLYYIPYGEESTGEEQKIEPIEFRSDIFDETFKNLKEESFEETFNEPFDGQYKFEFVDLNDLPFEEEQEIEYGNPFSDDPLNGVQDDQSPMIIDLCSDSSEEELESVNHTVDMEDSEILYVSFNENYEIERIEHF